MFTFKNQGINIAVLDSEGNKVANFNKQKGTYRLKEFSKGEYVTTSKTTFEECKELFLSLHKPKETKAIKVISSKFYNTEEKKVYKPKMRKRKNRSRGNWGTQKNLVGRTKPQNKGMIKENGILFAGGMNPENRK